jgi:dTDP-glucose pyrophosphorylase
MINIVIPMAGLGSRFANAGFEVPKPLIEIQGRPMIEWVVKSIGNDSARYIYIVQEEHLKEFDLERILRRITPKSNMELVPIDYITEGQASSVLLAEPFIDNYDSMMSFNCDQVIDWTFDYFLLDASRSHADGGILTFKGNSPKWSYAEVKGGWVTRTAEKDPISEHATVGAYFWTRGMDFVRFAKEMISENVRVNGEFYSCPVYNWAIRRGGKFIIYDVDAMYGTGTPEELKEFLRILNTRGTK